MRTANELEPQSRAPAPLAEAYRHLWNDLRVEMYSSIVWTIRKMGFPKSRTWSRNDSGLRGSTYGSVKSALLADAGLRDDIAGDTFIDFLEAAREGIFVDLDHARAWTFRVLQRKTWKRATARARELFTLVESAISGESAPERVAGEDAREQMESRELRATLMNLIAELTDAEHRLLEASTDGEYAELARELGVTRGALRVRVHRLRKQLRRHLRGH